MAYEYYEVLGISRTASDEEIKKAYRKRAMECHPDRHGGDTEKEREFKQINEAYATLSDPAKRRRYDRHGTPPDAASAGAGGFHADFDFSDIFDSFFGWGFSRWGSRSQTRGGDREVHTRISFTQSISGVSQTISYRRKVVCKACDGTGAKNWEMHTCPECHGAGWVRRRMQSIFGVVDRVVECPRCHGAGKIPKEVCDACQGQGVQDENAQKSVDIPAGIDTGMSMKISGEGDQMPGWRPGDLYVHVDVESPPDGMRRDDVNLRYTLALDPVELVLGVEKTVKIPVIGERTIDIGAGTPIGKVLRFIGDGVPHIGYDRRGDLFVEISVKIPAKLSKKERELYESLAKEWKIPVRKPGMFSQLFEA